MVLGGGRVGSAIVRDLAADDGFSVLGVDLDPVRVERMTEFGAEGMVADLSELGNVSKVIADADLVVGAVPGFMGYRTVERVLQEGKPMVDISFFPEDAFGLDRPAREAGVCCLVDCGIAPGLSNLILGRMEEHLDETTSFHCLVGGLPVERTWPWEYKAPFSPGDVIEEYVRPRRLRRDGVEITLPALSEVELVDFPGLGSLEAFNTDGLRSLLRTCKAPDMVEKTMRYPGHAVRMRILREAGFFSTEEVQAASGVVRPRDVTEALLFSAWRFEEGEPDLTVMRIVVEGTQNGGGRPPHLQPPRLLQPGHRNLVDGPHNRLYVHGDGEPGRRGALGRAGPGAARGRGAKRRLLQRGAQTSRGPEPPHFSAGRGHIVTDPDTPTSRNARPPQVLCRSRYPGVHDGIRYRSP